MNPLLATLTAGGSALAVVLAIAAVAFMILIGKALQPELDVAVPGVYQDSAGFTRTNRTGATIAQGGCAIIDHAQAEAESTSVALGQQNLTAVTTALLKAGRFAFCLERDGVADNGEGRFCDIPGAVIQVLVESTTDIAKGDLLKGVNGQAYLVKATNGTDRPVARALEARTSNDTGLIYAQIFPEGILAIA